MPETADPRPAVAVEGDRVGQARHPGGRQSDLARGFCGVLYHAAKRGEVRRFTARSRRGSRLPSHFSRAGQGEPTARRRPGEKDPNGSIDRRPHKSVGRRYADAAETKRSFAAVVDLGRVCSAGRVAAPR